MKRFLIFSLGVIMLAVMPQTSLNAQGNVTIKVVSHDSMYNRTNVVSKLYMHKHPDVKVVVEKVPLVQDSLARLGDSSVDVVMASRLLNDQESEAITKKGVQLYERLIGYGGLVIITDRANSMNDLTLSQVKKVFAGEISNWKEIGGPDKSVVVVRTGETFPGTNVYFEKEILGGVSIKKEATVVPDFYKTMFTVSQTPGAVGFVRIRDAFESSAAADAPVKVLKIRRSPATVAIVPSRETLENGLYPIKRPYFLYYRDPPKPEVAGYVDFVLEKGWGSEQ
jgi:phosphate transport system substrate-binding protein